MYYRPNVSKTQDRGLSAAFTLAICCSLLQEEETALLGKAGLPHSTHTTLLVNNIKWKVVVGKEG
jgi:hypothetical protein